MTPVRYFVIMKTAISIPDNVYERAEKLAKKKKISRSRLYTDAIEKYLDGNEKEKIIEQINKVCAKVDTSADPVLLKMALLSLPKDKW
jgi:metal-responsive CopG/Arc/MetJ family transcriptional regulator